MRVFTCQHLNVVGFLTFGFGFYAFLANTICPTYPHGTLRAVLPGTDYSRVLAWRFVIQVPRVMLRSFVYPVLYIGTLYALVVSKAVSIIKFSVNISPHIGQEAKKPRVFILFYEYKHYPQSANIAQADQQFNGRIRLALK